MPLFASPRRRLSALPPTDLPAPGAGGGVRRLVVANLAVLAVAACFVLVYRFAAALFILFVGIALGMAVKPGVDWLRRRGVPRWAGALAVYLALGAAAAGVLLLAVPVIAEQIGNLIARGPHQVQEVRHQLLSSSSRTLRRIAAYLPATLGERPGAAAPTILDVGELLTYASAVGRNVFIVAAVLLLGFYWTLEGDRRVRELVFFAPLERRRAIRAFVVEVERKVGAYLRGQAFVCVVIGALAFILYRLIGVPYAPILGLIYAIGEAVPVLGPIVGTAAAALVALSVTPALVLWVLAVAAVLQLIENYVLIPRVMDRTVGVNPLVTLLAISAFGSVLGIAGAVLAIPLAATVQLLVDRFLLGARAQQQPAPAGRDRLSVVRYEVQELTLDVRKLLRLRDGGAAPTERVEDAVEGIAADLDRLLADIQPGGEPPR
jgi:predicted PurR-regulated permease PerM